MARRKSFLLVDLNPQRAQNLAKESMASPTFLLLGTDHLQVPVPHLGGGGAVTPQDTEYLIGTAHSLIVLNTLNKQADSFAWDADAMTPLLH